LYEFIFGILSTPTSQNNVYPWLVEVQKYAYSGPNGSIDIAFVKIL
jgi:hypothetical protein